MTLDKLFLITAILPFALCFFSDVCFECQFLVKPVTQVFFELHFFNVFAIDFIAPLHIQFFGSYCHVNTFVDIKRQKLWPDQVSSDCKSSCMRVTSDLFSIRRYKFASSANRNIFDAILSGIVLMYNKKSTGPSTEP